MSDPSLAGDLLCFLRAKGCAVESLSEDTLRVVLPEVPLLDAATLEVELYVRVWEVLHPDAYAEPFPA